MATLGSLIISLEANTARFESAMSKAEYMTNQSTDRMISSLKGVGIAVAGMISVSAMRSLFTSVTDMESSLLKMATRLNTNVETLSSLGVVARKTGMDAESFNITLQRIEKSAGAAAKGIEQGTGKFDEYGEEIGKGGAAWRELGVDAQQYLQLPLDQKIMLLAEAMEKNVAPSRQLSLMLELGGKSAGGFIVGIKEGPEAIQKMIDRQKELGTITTDMAKRGTEAKTAVADLSTAFSAFSRNLIDTVGPTITTIVNILTDAIIAFRRGKLDLLESFSDVQARKAVGDVFGASFETQTKGPGLSDAARGALGPPSMSTGTKGSGKGSGDMGLDRMSTIIDTLRKDLNKLTEGSLAEITAWATHMRNEIEKVGAKGADTSVAMALVDKTETAKKLKATEDYNLFVAKESGDTYTIIEAQGKADLEKYKGFATAKAVTDAAMARKKLEEDRKNEIDRDNLLKGYLEGMASITLELQEQYNWKKKALALEIQMSKQALEDSIRSKGKGLTPGMADEQRSLLALTNQTKKFKLEWESVAAQTQIYSQLLSTIGSSFSSVLTGIAAGTMTVSQGITTLLQSVQDAILTMIMNMVMKWAEGQVMILGLNAAASMGLITQEAAVAGAKAYSAYADIPFIGLALGAAAAAVVMGIIMAMGSSIKSSAGGDYQVLGSGLREVHKDETILPSWAANSWRDIVNQGAMPGEGPGENGRAVDITVNHSPTYLYRATQKDYDRDAKMLTKAIKREMGNKING